MFWNNPLLNPNPHGRYTDTPAEWDDFAVYRHSRSGRYFVDYVGRGGTHTLIGSAKGYSTLPEAMTAARREAHRRDIGDAIIWGIDREGNFHQLGHAPKSHQTFEDPTSIEP